MGFYDDYKKWIWGGGAFLLLLFIILLSLGLAGVLTPEDDENPPQARLDCMPDRSLNEKDCQNQGCLYDSTTFKNPNVPKCYRDSSKNGFFKMAKVLNPPAKTTIYDLESPSGQKIQPVYSPVFIKPRLTFEEKSKHILHMKFHDANADRYEVPIDLQPITDSNPNDRDYQVKVDGDTTNGIRVVRKSTNKVIFDMSLGGLFLEDQFLQISTKLPSTYCYGFGENRHRNLRHKFDWRTWPMFSRDHPPTTPHGVDNLYGVHPFFMCVDDNGDTHGVFLLNSNAMEYQFQPVEPAVTLRSIGGILDFYIFMGPTPEQVIQQYTQLLGRMFIPPYWGLGFQISRWGFENLDHVKKIVKRNVDAKVPLDSVYGDIDYMRHRQDFTYDQNTYKGLPEYIKQIHDDGMRYVIILDPAIHVDSNIKHPLDALYRPYTLGVDDDIFIKWPEELIPNITTLNSDSIGVNRIMLGKVWPDGRSAFPDFFKDNTLKWWDDMIKDIYDTQNIKFDALWIDMNEVASFETNGDASKAWYCNNPNSIPGNHTCFALQCPKNNKYENPPYKPVAVRNWGENAMLSDKTICMVGETAYKDNKVSSQYNLHSLYGWSQSEQTARAAEDVRKKRSFAFSRSTYPSGQRFVGHWLGDNEANYEELRWSLIGLLEFSMFGYGYVGADLCGFTGNSTEALCSKWMAAGAFYPFCRSHNGRGYIEQDPAEWPATTVVAIRALGLRYSLLPYLYTLFYKAHVNGHTVSRPLHHEYPKDTKALDIDDQFLWGSSLLISPIVNEANERQVYVPSGKGHFYSMFTGERREQSYLFKWDGKENVIALDVRAGHIIPQQYNATNTRDSRNKDFYLTIVADKDTPNAEGELYWDDGESIDPVFSNPPTFYLSKFKYSTENMTLTYTVEKNTGPDMTAHKLTELRIYSDLRPLTDKLNFFLDQSTSGSNLSFSATIRDSILIIKGPFPMERSFNFWFTVKK